MIDRLLPQLVLETGFHTAPIHRIDVARDGTVLTVSSDKTARLWRRQGASFVQERVLWVPWKADNEGKLYAGAISTDGGWIAVGGRTSWGQSQRFFVYLFERASGRLFDRLGPFPEVITHLSWSEDSTLVVCLGGAQGIRVYRWPSGQLLWQDTDYGDASYGACWLIDGLVTSCYDGQLRRYNQHGQKTACLHLRNGNQPYGVASDGKSLLLVGFEDRPAVACVRLTEYGGLEEGPLLDTCGANNGSLGSVAYSTGQWWAGGMYAEGINLLMRWPDPFRPPKLVDGPQNTVMDLAPASDGGILVAAGDPQFMLLDHTGRLLARRKAVIPDYRGQSSTLGVSPDARVLRVSLRENGSDPVVLDLIEGRLAVDSELRRNLAIALTDAPGWNWEAWQDSPRPCLNGQPVQLLPYEWSRALAIAPSGSAAVLGTDWRLRCYDSMRQEHWQKPVPASAWAVAVSGDNHSVVVAYGNGMLGWHRLDNGQRYLTAFIHAEKRQWVAWTPSGYWWGSDEAEGLLKWHVDRGPYLAPDVVPANAIPATYRPDVVRLVLRARDENELFISIPPAYTHVIECLSKIRKIGSCSTLVTEIPAVIKKSDGSAFIERPKLARIIIMSRELSRTEVASLAMVWQALRASGWDQVAVQVLIGPTPIDYYQALNWLCAKPSPYLTVFHGCGIAEVLEDRPVLLLQPEGMPLSAEILANGLRASPGSLLLFDIDWKGFPIWRRFMEDRLADVAYCLAPTRGRELDAAPDARASESLARAWIEVLSKSANRLYGPLEGLLNKDVLTLQEALQYVEERVQHMTGLMLQYQLPDAMKKLVIRAS